MLLEAALDRPGTSAFRSEDLLPAEVFGANRARIMPPFCRATTTHYRNAGLTTIGPYLAKHLSAPDACFEEAVAAERPASSAGFDLADRVRGGPAEVLGLGSFDVAVEPDGRGYAKKIVHIYSDGGAHPLHNDNMMRDAAGTRLVLENLRHHLSVVMCLQECDSGGELAIHRKKWQPADERFEIVDGLGYDEAVTAGAPAHHFKPETGGVYPLNPIRYHSIEKPRGTDRVTMGLSSSGSSTTPGALRQRGSDHRSSQGVPVSAPLPPTPAPLVTAPVRRLDPAELPHCLRLSQDRKWPLEDRKWALLLEVGDVYGIDAPDGGLAGAVVATRYGTRLTAISMMLVAERFARRGLGRGLMLHALEHSGAATAALTATDDGRPLYERVGFRTIGQCFKYTGVHSPGSSAAPGTSRRVTRRATADDLTSVLALDAEVFGAPRAALLTRLQSFCEDFRVVGGPSGIAGFGGAWRNVDNVVIGPVVAQDTDTALALIGDLTANAGGECRLDLEDRVPELIAWAEEHGFRRGSATAVMVHGDPLPGDRTRLYTPVMVALG